MTFQRIALAICMLASPLMAEQTVTDAAQAEAVKTYPDLAVQGSDMNQNFVTIVRAARASKDPILNRPDWPLLMAERAAAMPPPLVFPPGASDEVKKLMIREHLMESRKKLETARTKANLAASEAARKNAAEAALRGFRRTIREVETDMPSFFDKPIILTGSIDVSSYYNYAFQGAQEKFYSFSLSDARGDTANLYMQKDEKSEALRRLILSSGKQDVDCRIGISAILYQRESSIHAYLLDYKLAPKSSE